MIYTFLAIIAASLVLALASRRGHDHQGAKEFFTASGQFGPVLFFFLSVGETYSVASMLGFPGGVYAKGGGFITWFFGYILLAAPVLYFVGPLIWRAGALYGSATIPDWCFCCRHHASPGTCRRSRHHFRPCFAPFVAGLTEPVCGRCP